MGKREGDENRVNDAQSDNTERGKESFKLIFFF